VDAETDAAIQKCIRSEFSDVTLLCIAHRLATIVSSDSDRSYFTRPLSIALNIRPDPYVQAFYDKVLVMDSGQIAEFDNPLILFDRPDSIFRSMCDSAKLTREAIVRIRAGENLEEMECSVVDDHRLGRVDTTRLSGQGDS
jgi:ATP-binding cassette subfamily C (CFTR/MRP) protein 1